MVKQANIFFRIDDGLKQRIVRAAHQTGVSMSEFIEEAATKAVERLEKRCQMASATSNAGPAHMHGGVPTFFRSLCATASRGGDHGYTRVGFQLAQHVGGEVPYTDGTDDWAYEVVRLNKAVSIKNAADRRKATLAWFDEHFPRIMKLIPRRRRRLFVEGVDEYVDRFGEFQA